MKDANTNYRVVPAPKLVRKDKRAQVSQAADVFAQCQDIRHAHQEHMVVFYLNARQRVIERRIVAIGTLTGVEVHARDVFRPAIELNASSVALAHNHPSGEPEPSREDIRLTGQLRAIGKLCGIPVLDHIVVASDGFVSIRERQWLNDLDNAVDRVLSVMVFADSVVDRDGLVMVEWYADDRGNCAEAERHYPDDAAEHVKAAAAARELIDLVGRLMS